MNLKKRELKGHNGKLSVSGAYLESQEKRIESISDHHLLNNNLQNLKKRELKV